MLYLEIIFFVLITILFFYFIYKNKKFTRCNKVSTDLEEYDGNGENQYLGRGHSNETVENLLNRIDWTAKHANTENYTKSFIVSYCVFLCIFFILAIAKNIILKFSEMGIIFASIYIVVFSISNLFGFHTDRYSSYYIRQNIEYIQQKLLYKNNIPETPLQHNIPHRTLIDEVLYK